MMDPQIKAKWLADLRSGKYRQTTGELHYDGAYCCLGVLCLSVGAEFKKAITGDEWFSKAIDNAPVLDGQIISCGAAPELGNPFMRRIGLTDVQESFLIMKNDDGDSFAAIADYIEANL